MLGNAWKSIVFWTVVFLGIYDTAGNSPLNSRPKKRFPYRKLQAPWAFLENFPSASQSMCDEFERIYRFHSSGWRNGEYVRGEVELRYHHLLSQCPNCKNYDIEQNLRLLEKYERH